MTCRPASRGGFGLISFAALDGYGRRYGVTDLNAFERFRGLIASVNRAYLATMAKKRSATDRDR